MFRMKCPSGPKMVDCNVPSYCAGAFGSTRRAKTEFNSPMISFSLSGEKSLAVASAIISRTDLVSAKPTGRPSMGVMRPRAARFPLPAWGCGWLLRVAQVSKNAVLDNATAPARSNPVFLLNILILLVIHWGSL